MATVTVTWQTQDQAIPNAATFTTYLIKILAAADNSVVATAQEPLGTTTQTFPNINPGDYIASVELDDAGGNPAAPASTKTFTVPAAATAPVPVTVDVALS